MLLECSSVSMKVCWMSIWLKTTQRLPTLLTLMSLVSTMPRHRMKSRRLTTAVLVPCRTALSQYSTPWRQTTQGLTCYTDMPTFPLVAEFSRFLGMFLPSRPGFMKSCCCSIIKNITFHVTKWTPSRWKCTKTWSAWAPPWTLLWELTTLPHTP